jgi:prepilin-type N-terminal cleavage/methylation domain-containing protein
MMRMMRGKKGFTLIEILFVITVVAILAAIVIPRLTTSATTAKEAACDANISNINTQVERWYFDNGSWPANDLSDIGADNDYFPSGIPTCPVTGSSYNLSATTHRVIDDDHNHD